MTCFEDGINREEVVLRIPAIAADVTGADAMLVGEIRSGKMSACDFVFNRCLCVLRMSSTIVAGVWRALQEVQDVDCQALSSQEQ